MTVCGGDDGFKRCRGWGWREARKQGKTVEEADLNGDLKNYQEIE
jgi:hypothetical protein